MSHDDLIDVIDEPEITAEDVRLRVEDWLRRLDELFGQIGTWAIAKGWSVESGAPVPMHEEPMKRRGLAARSQPSLTSRAPDGATIWIRPKALWVIGANGRVDIYAQKGVFVLVDVAESFQQPQWFLYRVGGGAGRLFAADRLADMI